MVVNRIEIEKVEGNVDSVLRRVNRQHDVLGSGEVPN